MDQPFAVSGRRGHRGLMLLVSVVAGGCIDRSAADHSPLAQALVWGGEHKLVASDAAENDQFGYAVALTDQHALVGATGDEFGRGAAYVFTKSGSAWVEEQKLVASDGAQGDSFGWSVAVAENRLVVGAYGKDAYRGAAYVFVKRTGEAWTEEQQVFAHDRAESDQFGASVALVDDRVLVGALGNEATRGAAYVFVRTGSTWTEEQKLVARDRVADDAFGSAVSLVGDQALIGAPGTDTYRGAAHLFVRTSDVWTEQWTLLASDGAEWCQFGNAVSLDAERALIGAYWDSDLRGAAYVFVEGGGSWTEEQKLVSSVAATGDRFGKAVSLAGARALIGAAGEESNRGAAYGFARSGAAWVQEQRLVASTRAYFDQMGWSVALAADTAFASADYADQLRGAAYAYTLGRANGDVCVTESDCASGNCTSGRCCDSDCSGACAACSIADGAPVDGTCTIRPAGSAGRPSCGALVCNGESLACSRCRSDGDCSGGRYCAADGTCQTGRDVGQACDDSAGSDCLSSGCHVCQTGFCADGVCCDAACDGTCAACSAKLKGAGDDGRCGPIQVGTDPRDECLDDGALICGANGLCDGTGACQRYPAGAACQPQTCTRGDACTSGHCEDGICCDRTCSPSERCRGELKVAGADGMCGPARVAVGGAPCKFDVQCGSGRCSGGTCLGQSTSDEGCGCTASGTNKGPSWLGLALGMILMRRGRRRY